MNNDPQMPVKKVEALADRMLENVAMKRVEPLYKSLEAVGYSAGAAKQPQRVMRTEVFRARMALNADKAAKIMSKRREEALKLMKEKQGEAKYRDLAYGVDIMTKNERLITGQATENVSMQGSLVVLPSKDAEFEDPETAQ